MKKTPLILLGLSFLFFSPDSFARTKPVQQDGLMAKRITNESPQDSVLDSLNNNSKILQRRALEEEVRSRTRTIEDRRKYREERAEAARKWEEQRRLKKKYKKQGGEGDASSDSPSASGENSGAQK